MTKNGQTDANSMPRFYWIDFLRGMAALSVLIWHYQHFYYVAPGVSTLVSAENQPLFSYLSFSYLHGHLAVQLFWCISGFVFAYVYSKPLNIKGIWSFVINRFARLYPIHFVTLILVSILQFMSFMAVGHYQIYPFNDIYHFILNIFFASNWGFEKGFSFNAPIWSVSVEIVVYLIFVFTLRFVLLKPVLSLILSVLFAGLYIINFRHFLFWRCGSFFFLGCTTYYYREQLIALKKKHLLAVYPTLGLAGLFLSVEMTSAGHALVGEILLLQAASFLVLSAHIVDRIDFSIGKRIRVIGDMTYGSYLWHIPIQIVALLFVERFNIERSVFDHDFSLMFYLTSVFFAAYFSLKYIEKPCQVLIRSKCEML